MEKLVKTASCPECRSTGIRRRSEYVKKVRVLYGVETFVVTQYCCRQCQTSFTDGIEGVKKEQTDTGTVPAQPDAALGNA